MFHRWTDENQRGWLSAGRSGASGGRDSFLSYARRAHYGCFSGRGFDSHHLHQSSPLSGLRLASQFGNCTSDEGAKRRLPGVVPEGNEAGQGPMYVYIIRSIHFPTETYVGSSADFKQRLKDHNNGKSSHTSKFKPWKLEVVVWFGDDSKAITFEKYLKSHSGRSFRPKHLESAKQGADQK